MNLHTLLETDLNTHVEFESERHKEEFMIEFSDMFFERLMERAYVLLSDEDDIKLDNLLESNATQIDVFTFLANKTPEFAGLVGEVFLDQRSEALEVLQVVN